ncbi:MAG: helix-turn-helix domain-containing protein [Deltaproteobacteria bacterium]|nr:helix-turn-helix domain-containing protein [Deltaproteobacteria bacterium]
MTMRSRNTVLKSFESRYVQALRAGSCEQAATVTQEALVSGVCIKKVYLGIIMPASREIGELLSRSEIAPDAANLATQIILSDMARLRRSYRKPMRDEIRAMITPHEGEPHFLAARAVADFLLFEGWQVEFLSSYPAFEVLAGQIESFKPHVVGISVSTMESLQRLDSTVKKIRGLAHPTKILIGGEALDEHSLPAEVAVDAVCEDAFCAVYQIRRLCGLGFEDPALDPFLKGIGERILACRKERHLSQKEVASLAGIDRAYLSSVESGKQNVTVGALMRIARALEITVEELI